MNLDKNQESIIIPKKLYDSIITHCLRKLNKEFLINETKEQQAFGIIGGTQSGKNIFAQMSIELCKNFRQDKTVNDYMNKAINDLAITSEMPVNERAWVSEPTELKAALDLFEENNMDLIGAYHMHHDNSWKGASDLDIPSELDEFLAKDTEIFMFIVRVSKEGKYSIRAFFEGNNEVEIKII
ncbi:hypothetical protein [Clostridium saccharoperbutylacetonicum]|uniref:hypothetical protein n=1 Tax=Clostridium saccharoperbutylacetonicum TaxID=36745 RepID=UPI0039E8908F